jgi:hypothetical protein
MWLVEAAGLRILMDPLLGDTYHAGTFEVIPRRRIDIDALRPDLIIVTHRHPDHFDPDSLHALARRYPDAVVLTADALVGRTAQRLGFTSVSLLDAWQHLALPGLDLLTTPSYCPVEEWGVLLASGDGVAWNQVDTELGDQVGAVLARAAEILDRPGLTRRLDLGIVRWQPLLQVNAMLGERTRFPARSYGSELDRIAACNAAALIPGAAGSQLVGDADWLNALAYPVSTDRVLRDLARRCPRAAIHPARPGAVWRLTGGRLLSEDDSPLITPLPGPDRRRFRPLSVPPVRDPDPDHRGTEALRAVIEPWLVETLAPALAGLRGQGRRVLALEIVYPDALEHWGFTVHDDAVVVSRGEVDDPDQHNAIAASDLAAVIQGTAHWGRALLGGRLRSSGRLYCVGEDGLEVVGCPPFFLYLAVSYEVATERWLESEVLRLVEGD